MKALFTLCIAMLACSQLWAQHRIVLKQGDRIDNVRLHEIKSSTIVYEQDMSLHDLLKSAIDYIESDTVSISFEEDGTAVYAERQSKASLSKSAINIGRTDHHVIVFATPTAMLDIMNTVQGGIEWKPWRVWSFVLEGGSIQNSWRRWGPGTRIDMTGWVTRGGIRFYDKGLSELFRLNGHAFLEGELYVKRAEETTQIFGSVNEMNSIHHTPILIAGVNAKFGVQRVYDNGIMVETWVGGGSQFLGEGVSYIPYAITAGIKVGVAL